MHRIRQALPYLLCLGLIALAVWQTIQARQISEDIKSIAESVDTLQSQQAALQDEVEKKISQIQDEHSRTTSGLQSQIDEMKFEPMDVDLLPELQL